jgi:hypothetical protein
MTAGQFPDVGFTLPTAPRAGGSIWLVDTLRPGRPEIPSPSSHIGRLGLSHLNILALYSLCRIIPQKNPQHEIPDLLDFAGGTSAI